MPDHVKLTGTDHQIKQDAEAGSCDRTAPVNEMLAEMPDQASVIINLLYTCTIPPLLKNFEILNTLDQLFKIY